MCPKLANRDRRALLAILVASFLLNAIPFWWGLPTPGSASWAFDEIPPHHHGQVVLQRHQGRYPPLHYRVLRVVYSPLETLLGFEALRAEPSRQASILRSTGRLVSALMATGTVLVLFFLTLAVFESVGGALLAAAFWSVSPLLAYYGKTINLEAPYLFWFACSLWFFWRAWSNRRTSDYWLYALTATLAVCTKDQTYGLYVAPSLMLWLLLAREGEGSWWRRAIGALRDRRILGALLIAVLAFTLIHDLVFDWKGFRFHLWVMLGPKTQRFQEWGHNPADHLAMAWMAVRHVAFILGVPVTLLSLVGMAEALRKRRRALVLLAFPVSYYLFFIVPLLFHYDRFLLPVALLLALFAGGGAGALASRLANRGRGGRVVAAVLLGMTLLHGGARAVTLDASMWNDARYSAERWMRQNSQAGDRVFVLGRHRQASPRLRPLIPWEPLVEGWGRELDRLDADYLVWNAVEARETGFSEFAELLQDASMNYVLASRHQWTPPMNLLSIRDVESNLRTINPEIVIVERVREVDRWAAYAAIDRLWRGESDDWRRLAASVVYSQGLRNRRYPEPGTVAFALNPQGWSYSNRPALLVVSNPGETPISPAFELRAGSGDGAIDLVAITRSPRGDERMEIPVGGRVVLQIGEVPSEGRAIVLVGVEQGWSPAGEVSGELGVRIRRIR